MIVKKLVEEVSGEGLESLLGERVLLLCANYFYDGKMVGVNDDCVLLEDALLVYETGAWDSKGYQDAQKLPGNWYVRTEMIESYGRGK